MTFGLSDVQPVMSVLTLCVPVSCEPFRKKLFKITSLTDLPFGIRPGSVMLNRTGPAVERCPQAHAAHTPITRMHRAFRQLRRCSISNNE